MQRPHYPDDLPQFVAVSAHAIRRQLIGRAALKVSHDELTAGYLLNATAHEGEEFAAARAPQGLPPDGGPVIRLVVHCGKRDPTNAGASSRARKLASLHASLRSHQLISVMLQCCAAEYNAGMGHTVEPDRLFQFLREAVEGLDECVTALSSSIPAPVVVPAGDSFNFRHLERGPPLMAHLKLVKIASHHNAALVLIEHGYVHEVYALCRMIDEANEDIFFLVTPLGEDGNESALQRKAVEEFFQEEFSRAEPDIVKAHQSRDRVPRAKVRAGISRVGGAFDGRNPSREVDVTRVLSSTFSGYVHGAYTHLMELFGGPLRRFHTRGMLGTPRMQECLRNHVSYVCRSLMATEAVAFGFGRNDVLQAVLGLNIELAKRTKCIAA
jgi:hypothetical protein